MQLHTILLGNILKRKQENDTRHKEKSKCKLLFVYIIIKFMSNAIRRKSLGEIVAMQLPGADPLTLKSKEPLTNILSRISTMINAI